MEFSESILDLVGHTPMVRLQKVARGVKPTILAKLAQLPLHSRNRLSRHFGEQILNCFVERLVRVTGVEVQQIFGFGGVEIEEVLADFH